MKQTAKCLLAGALPLAAGYLLNALVLRFPVPLLPVSLLFFALWGILSYRLAAAERPAIPQGLALGAFGLAMLALVAYQELVLGEYWLNFVGFASQMYFLPGLSLASAMVSPFLPVITLWAVYTVEWVLLLAVACAGCLLRRR